MLTLPTWGRRKKFSYTGSVGEGTTITYGKAKSRAKVSADQYAALLKHFRGSTVEIGTRRDIRPRGSVGEWLRQQNVTQTAIAPYVGPILIEEGYAEKVEEGKPLIRFFGAAGR